MSLNIIQIPTCLTSVYYYFLDFHSCRPFKAWTIFYELVSRGLDLQRFLGNSPSWSPGPPSKSHHTVRPFSDGHLTDPKLAKAYIP